MTISFDPAKRDLVLKQRGLDFAGAVNLFAGLHATAVDDRKDYMARCATSVPGFLPTAWSS